MLLTVIALLVVTTVLGQAPQTAPPVQYTGIAGGSTAAETVAAAILANLSSKTNGNIDVPYAPIGSGEGQKGAAAGTLDFGISDVPVSVSFYNTTSAAGTTLDQIPWSLGLFAVVVNLPGLPFQSVSLTACQVASIFSGKVKSWADTSLLNATTYPDVPDQSIKVVVRGDASGSTQILTNWLSTACPSGWSLGVNTTVPFPSSLKRAQGSDGVILAVTTTPYAISYLEYGLALAGSLTQASLLNNVGVFLPPKQSDFNGIVEEMNAVFPTTTTTSAWAAVNVQTSRLATAYPLTSIEYIMVPHNLTARGSRGSINQQVISQFLASSTQATLLSYGFAPLPAQLLGVAINGTNNLLVTSNGPNLGFPSAVAAPPSATAAAG